MRQDNIAERNGTMNTRKTKQQLINDYEEQIRNLRSQVKTLDEHNEVLKKKLELYRHAISYVHPRDIRWMKAWQKQNENPRFFDIFNKLLSSSTRPMPNGQIWMRREAPMSPYFSDGGVEEGVVINNPKGAVKRSRDSLVNPAGAEIAE